MVLLRRSPIRDVFGGVAGRMARGDKNRTEIELIASLHLLMRESVLRTTLVTEIDFGGLNPAAQFPRAADQIGMNVGLENVCDRDVLCARYLNVDLNVRSRIEDCGDTFLIISDQIRKRGQTFRLNGFKD